MTTREELQAIMDSPGFGTGRAFRDRKAQENEALALLPDPGGLPATRKDHGNSARVGKSCPTARQWVTGAVVKSLAVVILAACVPTVDRADCSDGATWRAACDRDRAAVERPEPEPGGHWATRDNEPDSRTDPEGHRDWQRDRDRQIEEGTW